MQLVKKLYYYDDIPTEEGKKAAREWYREGNTFYFLEEYMREVVTEQLEKIGYTIENLEVFYSLRYCQGDGASFSGTVMDTKTVEVYTVKQSGHYTHEYTMSAYSDDEEGCEQELPIDDPVLKAFRDVARAAARSGYEAIEAENKDEAVEESLRANEYTFTKGGERIDPDID